jgi:hypothetical protein
MYLVPLEKCAQCLATQQALYSLFTFKTIFNLQLGPGWLSELGMGLHSNSYKPITNTAWVRARLCKWQKRCTRLAAASDKIYQLLAHGRWFSPGTSVSSTTKSGRHDIAEILLKVALSTIYLSIIINLQLKLCTRYVYIRPLIWIFELCMQKVSIVLIYLHSISKHCSYILTLNYNRCNNLVTVTLLSKSSGRKCFVNIRDVIKWYF